MLKVKNMEKIEDVAFNLVWCNAPVTWTVDNEMVDYKLYQRDHNDIRKGQDDSIEILEILDQLGCPMESVGTYLFKAMILSAKESLLSSEDDSEKKELLAEMKSPFSQFYFDIARNDLDIGVKTFHQYVGDAISKINYKNVNKELAQNIFKNKTKEITISESAYSIADYLAKKQKQNEMSHAKIYFKKSNNRVSVYK